jgi:hypothetical protein
MENIRLTANQAAAQAILRRGLTMQRIPGTDRTFDIIVDGIWRSRVTIDGGDIHIRRGGITDTDELNIRQQLEAR